MTGVITIVVLSLAVVVMALTGWRAARDTAVAPLDLYAAALLQLGALAYVGVRIADLVGGHRVGNLAILVVYLVAVVLLMPVAGALAHAERTRWGAVTLGVGALVVCVLLARVHQLWTRGG